MLGLKAGGSPQAAPTRATCPVLPGQGILEHRQTVACLAVQMCLAQLGQSGMPILPKDSPQQPATGRDVAWVVQGSQEGDGGTQASDLLVTPALGSMLSVQKEAAPALQAAPSQPASEDDDEAGACCWPCQCLQGCGCMPVAPQIHCIEEW